METSSQIFYKTPQHKDIQHGITIMAHNVFWFQGVPFATDAPPEPRLDILEKLCALYKGIQPDVLCLQEIQSEETARLVAAQLEMEYLFRAGGGYPQYGGATFSRRPMEEIPLPEDTSPDRILIGTRVRFEGGRKLNIMNIHLPSNRQRGAEGGQKQRLLEVSRAFGEMDVLLGDFNERPDGPCAALLKKNGFVDAAEICGAGETPSNLSRKRGDQVWLPEAQVDSLGAYFYLTKEQLAIQNPEKQFLSDHLPVGCLIA